VISGTWRPWTRSKRRTRWTAHAASAVFGSPTLGKKVTLGAEVGEEVALGVLAAQILALSRCVGVSVVVKDVVLREIASTF